MQVPSAGQEWDAARYAANARFVTELGVPVLQLLAPQPGERVLDLGCGDGLLAVQLAELGCTVVAVDAAPDMVRAAKMRGVDARLADGTALLFTREFDAVFSNAALHWMSADPDAVVAGVARSLRAGGRFVGEFGGHGNVAAIVVALQAVLARRGIDGQTQIPWYFPSAHEYRERLTQHGFDVARCDLIPRPTPLPTGMAAWLETFADPFLRLIPDADRAGVRAEAVELLHHVLRDSSGRWTADYVRLRFAAVLQL